MKYASFISHITAAIIITGIMICVYAAVQQTYRSSANDPQIQIARDISYILTKGGSIDKLLPDGTIDLEQSQAVFVELFDKSGKSVQSTGLLNGRLPQPPQAIINYTNKNNEDMITWQPQSDVRVALVLEKVNAAGIGYIAAGRSLKETEVRERNLVKMVGIAWFCCMLVLLIHLLLQTYLYKNFKN